MAYALLSFEHRMVVCGPRPSGVAALILLSEQ